MSIDLYIPQFPLSTYIDCFWYVDLQVPYTREKILPSGQIELIINFGSPHRKYDRAGRTFELLDCSWLVGFQTEYIINEPVAETCMMGVRFKAGGARTFFREPLREFVDAVVPMDLVWGGLIDEMRERLLGVSTVIGKFSLLEKMLLKRFYQSQLPEPFVNFAIGRFLSTQGLVPVQAVCDEVGVSQKHLIHKFKQVVGVTPKQFGRVLKFQAVLQAIDPQQGVNWSRVAQQANYYDQPHFNRDFRRFTGLTPADYVRLRDDVFGDGLAAGEGVHFVPIIG